TGHLLQGVYEGHQLVLLSGAQNPIVVDHEVRFAVVPQYCVIPGQRLSVVHQSIPRPHSPQRRRPHEIGRTLPPVLNDAVSSPYVVQQEIPKRMDYLVAQRRRHRERTAVYHRTCGRCSDAGDVTDCAADGVENIPAGLGISGRGKGVVPRGRFRCSHKPSEYIYVVVNILGIGSYLANGREVSWPEAIRDPLLVEVSIAGEGEQARHLILPPKATYPTVSSGFENRDLNDERIDAAPALNDFVVGECNQRVAVDGLDKPITKGIEAGAERPDVLAARNPFLNVGLQEVMLHSICIGYDPGANSPVINQRAIGDRICAIIDEYGRVHKVAIGVLVAAAELSYLADAPADRVLMALTAGLGIVGRPKPFSGVVNFAERIAVSGNGCGVSKSISVKSDEAGGRLGGSLPFDGSGEGNGRYENRRKDQKHTQLH